MIHATRAVKRATMPLAAGAAAALAVAWTIFADGDAATSHARGAPATATVADDATLRAELDDCRARAEQARVENETAITELQSELVRERALRLDREREWLRYTQGIARLRVLAGAPTFDADVPADERETRALETAAATEPDAATTPGTPAASAGDASSAEATAVLGPAAVDPSQAKLERAARLAREERSRAVHLALRSLFSIEHVSGLDLLESGVVADGATGPVVLRVIDDRGRPLGSLYAERLRLEGSRSARTLTLLLEHGWERRGGVKTPFEGGPADAEGRAGQRRIELAHVDPTPWYEALPELFHADQRTAVTEGDPLALNALRFELNRLFRADASGPVYRLESLAAKDGLVLREVHVAVLTPELLLERELFADHMTVLRAEKGLEIVLTGGSQIRGTEKAPFLDGRYRIFLPRADAARWEAAGVPVGTRERREIAAPAGG